MNHQGPKDTKERTRRNSARLCDLCVLVLIGLELCGCRGTAESGIKPPSELDVSQEPRIYVADWANHRLVRMNDMRGTGWTTLGDERGQEHALRFPVGACLDLAGRIYVSEQYHERII